MNHEKLLGYLMMDKKAQKNGIQLVQVSEIGQAHLETKTFEEMKEMLQRRESE